MNEEEPLDYTLDPEEIGAHQPLLNYIQRIKESGKVPNYVVDFGAHAGIFSLGLARLGAKKIVSFEPTPDLYSILTGNVIKNNFSDVITPLPFAIVAPDQTGKPLEMRQAGNLGQRSLVYNSQFPSVANNCLGLSVEQALKIALQFMPHIDFLKVDIEGSEWAAFRESPGLTKMLKKVKYIQVDLHYTDDAYFFGDSNFVRDREYKTLKDYLVSVIGDGNVEM